jgi:prevent-host-death family protein
MFYMEKELGITEAREKLSDMVEQVQYQGETYIINRHGKPAVAVVPIEVYENWKHQRKMFFDAIRGIQEANKTIDPEQVWDDVLQAQQAIRSSNP